MVSAFKYATVSFISGCIFIIHGIYPDLFVEEGSRMIEILNNELSAKKINSSKEN
jgi:hypothetical protein